MRYFGHRTDANWNARRNRDWTLEGLDLPRDLEPSNAGNFPSWEAATEGAEVDVRRGVDRGSAPRGGPRALAVAHGFAPSPLGTFRYLELGSGSAASLRALAAVFPDAEFVGVEGPGDCERASLLATRVGLANLRHVEAAALEGTFDFVVVHDRLARMSPEARRGVLGLASKHLAPSGIVLVTYPTLPGAALHGLTRRILGRAVRDDMAPTERQWAVRARFAKLLRALPDREEPHLGLVHDDLVMLRTLAEVAPQDLLAEAPTPLSVADVLADARATGLELLCDAEPATLDGAFERGFVAARLDDGFSRAEAEEVLDLVVHRRSRATLLCKTGRARSHVPDWTPLAREGCFAAALTWRPAEADASPSFEPGVQMPFELPSGVRIGSDEPLLKATLAALAHAWPRGRDASALMAEATAILEREGLATPERTAPHELEAAIGSLLTLVEQRQVELLPWAPSFDEVLDYAPRLRSVSRLELALGDSLIDCRHHAVVLDAVHRQVALLLDGEHQLEDCRRALLDRVDAGALALDGLPLSAADRTRAVERLVLSCLVRLRNLGVLEPSLPEADAEPTATDEPDGSNEGTDHAP